MSSNACDRYHESQPLDLIQNQLIQSNSVQILFSEMRFGFFPYLPRSPNLGARVTYCNNFINFHLKRSETMPGAAEFGNCSGKCFVLFGVGWMTDPPVERSRWHGYGGDYQGVPRQETAATYPYISWDSNQQAPLPASCLPCNSVVHEGRTINSRRENKRNGLRNPAEGCRWTSPSCVAKFPSFSLAHFFCLFVCLKQNKA